MDPHAGGRPAVDHTVYEHSSIIKFISDNWGLPYLTTRHAQTNSIGNAFRGFASYDPDRELRALSTRRSGWWPMRRSTTWRAARSPEVPLVDLPVDFAGSDLHRLAAIGWFDNLPVRTDYRIEDCYRSAPKALLAEVTAGLPTGPG